MASGKFHAKITTLAIAPVGLLAYMLTQDLGIAGAASAGCLMGLKIHPDLDLSRAWLWRPYSKMFRHRSPWSHWPALGTSVRLLYLLGWLVITTGPLALGWIALGGWIRTPVTTALHLAMLVAAIWGLMVADGLHWLVDVVGTRWKQTTNKKRRRPRKQGIFT